MLRNIKAIVPLILLALLSLSSSFTARAQAPVAAFNANDTIVCIGSALSFTDASVAGANPIVNWDWSFGDGGTSTNQDPSRTFNVAGTFVTQLIVTDAVGLKDTATQTVYVVEANVNQSLIRLCSPTNSTTISAVDQAVAGVSSYWLSPSPTVVIATALNDTTLVSNLASGLNTIFWVVAYGSCTLADQVSIFVDTPINSNAGPDQQICSTPGTTNLAGNNPNPGTGIWTTTSSASITNPNNRNSAVTGLSVAGTYTFVWSITNGACVSRDTMVITVSSPIVSNAGVDQSVCTTTGTATLVGSNPSPGTGVWSTTSSATIATPSSATTGITGLTTAGNYNFVWTITNGTCITRDTIRVVVTAPVASNAGSDIQVCTSTASGTLNGNNPSPGTGLWTAVTSGTITSPSSATTTVTGLSVAGFYSFVWTITNGPCISRDTVTIIVRTPVVANAGVDQTFCNTSTASLTGNSPSPGTALWTTTGSSTITSPTSASTTVSNLAFGNNTFVYTTSYGACISRDTVIIRRDSLITSNAGPDQQICESSSSITLAGNSAAPGTGVWTKTNGGTITTPSSATSTVTGLTAGTHSFIWTITNGICTSRDTMRVVVNTQVASNAGLDDQVCQGSTSSLSGNNPSPAIGLWTTTSSATIATPSSPNTNITGLTNAGVYTFIWTVTNGACILRDTARITVDSSIVANAGVDKRVCTVNSTTLLANTPTLGTGLWTSLGTAGVSNPNLAAATATSLVYGNNLFVWTITNGTCINRDTINVIRDSVVTARAGADRSICSSVSTLNLAGNTPASGTGLWTTTSLATITTPSSPTSAVTGYSTPGSYTFVWTITNGSCTSRDTVVITVDQAVNSNAGVDQSICSSTSSITMAGSNPAPGTGIWTALGAGTIAAPNSSNTNVTDLAVGSNIFTWTIINGVCTSEDTVVINVSQLVTSNAGPNQTVCQGTTVTLAGNNPTPGTGAWTALNGGTISSSSSQSPTVTGLSTAGTYNFVWTITNGSCVSRDTVAIIVSALVASNAGSDQSLCAATTATLAGNNPAPGTGTWTSLGTALVTSPSNQNSGVTALVAGTNSFVWTVVNGGCTSRDTVVINRSQLVTSNAGPNQTVCQGTTVTLAGNNPTPGTGAWTALNGGTISSSSSQSPTVTGLSTAGTYNFVWTITNGSCVSRDTVAIIVSALVAANAGVDQSLCAATTATLAGNNPAPGTGTWISLGTALITSPSNQNSGVTALIAGANSFVWTIVNGGCTSRDTVIININTIIPVNAGIDQQLCSGSSISLSANNPAPGSGTWTALNGGVITSASNPTTTITGISSAGNYNFVWTVVNGSCTSRDTVLVQISDPVTSNAGSDQQLCNTFNANLSANNPSPGTGAWTTSGSAIIATAGNQNSAVSGLSFGSNEFIWTITNGSCITRDTLNIVVDSIIVSDAGADQQVCAGTSTILSGSDAFPAIGLWTSLNGGLIGDSSSQNTTLDSLNFAGTYSFVWTITNGVCISSDTTLVLVDSLVIADAGVDQKYCETFNTVLTANNSTPGFGTWNTNGTATIADPNDPASAVSNLSYGVNEFVWTINNGTCTSSDTVVVNVDSLIIANAGVDQTICSGSILTLVGNSPGLGESDWVAVDAGTIADPSLQTISITDLSVAGIYTFEYSISNGVCYSLDTVIVTVDSLISANAGTDQAFCNTFTSTLAGNSVLPGIGTWSTLGSATFTDVNDPLTDVADLDFGDNVFIWSVTNGVCTSEDTITIHVDSIIVADAGADQTICSGIDGILSGSSAFPGTSLWTALNGGSIADSSLENTIVSSINILGVYAFEYSINNGLCTSLDTVLITVDSLITSNAGTDQTLCNTFTSTLGGNNVFPGVGFWSTFGSATFTDANDPLTDVANLDFGDNILIWSVTSGVCTSEDTVLIHVDSVIVADAGTDQDICQSIGSTLLNANDPLPGQGLWTTSSPAIFADSSSFTSSVSNLNFVGSYQLVWTITNGVCVSIDTVVINVDSSEVADAGADQQFCETITSANLNATPATVGVGFWTSLGTATIVDSANSITQVDSLVLGDNLFVYTITNGTCITTDTTNINISQLSSPANAGIDQEQCASVLTAAITGNIPSVGVGSWTSLGTATIDSASSVSTTVSNLQLGNNFFVYSIVNGACISEDTINILLNPLPVVDAGADQFVTSLTPVIIGGSPTASNGSGTYNYAWSPSSVLDDSTLSNPTATVNSTTIFTVFVIDSLGCQGTDTVIVWVNNPPIASNDTVVTNEDSVLVIDLLLNDTDLDNNINLASVSNISGPFNGSIVIDTLTGFITYTSNANYYGADSIFYTVCDSGMPVYCDTAWIYINILPINDAPLAIDDTASTVEDSCIQIAVLANDSDVENAIIVSSLTTFGGPSNGTLTLDTLTGIITYCPDSNFAGVDTFYYAICDSGFPAPGLCDTAIVVITVNTNNDPPIALSDSAVICSSDSVFISILGNDIDPENDSLSASILTPPSNGIANLGSNFDLFYSPDSVFNGVDSIQYVVCDNQSPAGCDTAWVYINVNGVPQITLVTTDVKCFGDSSGAVDLTVVGNAPYVYTWSNGSVDEDIDSLIANTYIILVTDTFGCTSTSFTTVNQPLVALSGLLNVQPILCNGDSSGTFDLVVSGGTSPYTYTWSNGSTDEDIDSLVVGNYTVIIADSNGCIVTLTDSISQPDSALSVIANVQNVSCGGDSTGAISISVVGGSGGYLYAWSNGSTTDSITNVPAGLYSVTVYDSNNCQLVVTDSILDINAPISITPTVVDLNCISGIQGSISIAASGGVGNYIYSWSTGDSTNLIDSLSIGSYSLTVSDSLGCSDTISFSLVDSSSALINVLGNVNICEGDSIVLEVNNLVGASYQWTQNGTTLMDTTYQLIVDSAGTFDVTVTTGCGIFTSPPISTTLNPIPVLTTSSDISVPCDSLITLDVSGANNYSWFPANLVSDSTASSVTVSIDQTTSFIVTGYSSVGCAVSDTIIVTVTCDTLFVPSGFSPNGDGKNDFFVVSNLAKYPNATLKIFNRWGNLVYIKDRYDNSWNGFSNSDKIRLGEELPNGTYFYVFEPNNGEDSKQGFVILRR